MRVFLAFPPSILLWGKGSYRSTANINKEFILGGITIQFQPITLEDRPLFDQYFAQRRYEGSECTFTNLFMWRKAYHIEWAHEDGCLFVKASNSGRTFVLPPFGPEHAYPEAVENLIAYFRDNNLPFWMNVVPRWMCEILERMKPGFFAFRADRNNFDYVYNAIDLIELKGRKYDGKRNHIKKFKKEFPDFQYVALTESLAQACIDNELDWCVKRNCDEVPSLRCEKYAIIEALTHYKHLEIRGGVILINDKVEAFTFGEMLNADTAIIHVEKANPDIRGIYPVINQEFCKHNWQSATYINREEDMGIEGLKKAKESYYPVMMIEKYDVTLA